MVATRLAASWIISGAQGSITGLGVDKTEAGAVWLDPEKTSPYDFYQYWRNTDDRDVERFLALYTFLPMDEVRRLGALKDREINEAKKVLAYEVTRLTHGEEAAKEAQKAAKLYLERRATKVRCLQ